MREGVDAETVAGAATTALVACWRGIADGRSGWFWVCCDSHYGDIYQYCSLLACFRAARGSKVPIYLVAASNTQADVGRVFADQFTEVLVAPALMADAAGWAAFFGATGLAPFAPNAPLLLNPQLNPGTDVDAWSAELFGGRTIMTPVRALLRLPPDAEPQAPPRLEFD